MLYTTSQTLNGMWWRYHQKKTCEMTNTAAFKLQMDPCLTAVRNNPIRLSKQPSAMAGSLPKLLRALNSALSGEI